MVNKGVTVGLDTVELKPAGTELHEYVLPGIAFAPSMVELELKQIDLSAPATAAGTELTVTTTLFVLVQPVAVVVSITVYVAVVNGFIVGFAKVEVNTAGSEVQL